MRTFPTTLLLVSVLLIAAGVTPEIQIDHVWARASAGTSTGAAYLTMINKGPPDRLIGVTTPIAASAELHETTRENGVMKMRPVGGLALATDQPVTLAPGGYHVMLTGLKSPLKAGDDFPLTLSFEHAQPITVTVKVEALGSHGQMGRMP
jgi:periplasmic copper chaperone A